MDESRRTARLISISFKLDSHAPLLSRQLQKFDSFRKPNFSERRRYFTVLGVLEDTRV